MFLQKFRAGKGLPEGKEGKWEKYGIRFCQLF
jgi:hypothetical protein